MNEHLQRLNEADRETAESIFRDCCGSMRWSKLMAGRRPFTSEEEILQTASKVWRDLGEVDWLEAFASHPRIGEKRAAGGQQKRSAEWSKGEQAGVIQAAERTVEELEDANRLYEQKFGFIFIVCASGKSGDEMLSLCRTRSENTRETEISNAAEEQRKITEIRLKKLLHQ